MARRASEPLLLTNATLIDVVVMVFARSRMRELVGTDALKTILQGTQRDLFSQPKTLALQPIWELLESQAGFDREQATPPICRLKLLEDKLQITVHLPVELEQIDRETIERSAAECAVTFAEVDKVIAPPRPTIPPALRAVEVVSLPSQPASNSRHKLAVVAAVIGLGAAGVSAYLTLSEDTPVDHSQSVPPGEISRDIPLREVRLDGTAMLGVLADPRWSIEPEALRRRHLEEAAPAVRAHGANALIIVDPGGIPAGSLTLIGKPTVMFTPVKKR